MNVAVKWTAILLCIWEVLGSYLRLETGNHDLRIFVVFLSPPGKCRVVNQIRPQPLPSASFLIYYLLTIL
jgi:hypothetical protein